MAEKRVPYTHKPEEISLEEWQTKLRKQFATDQKFKFSNMGDHPVYSDFEVFNPESGKTYKVSIRDNKSSFHYCSCPDFSINGLGTCKHIEYLLHYFSKYKKYQKHLLKPHIPRYSSLSISYGTERKIWLKKALNEIFFTGEDELFDKSGYLKTGKLEELSSFISRASENEPDFRVYPDVLELIEVDRKNRSREKIAENLFANGNESEVFNGLIRTDLYPYQKEGVKKIVETGRILLADEMGLGKTIQAIAATEILAKHFGVERVLIICPTSLKYQWKREISRFTGRNAMVIEGSPKEREELYVEKAFYKIISYGICRNDQDHINQISPDLVIMDEAQRIKNWKTKTAQSVKKIRSEFAIVLTGTPLENRIEELHSLVEYIDRYKLGPLFRFLDKHQILDEKGKLKGYKDLRNIYTTLNDVLLRRNRSAIIDQLPGRMDKNYFVEMTDEQLQEHNMYYDIVSKLVNLWRRQGFLSEEDRERLLMSLNCMRMVCDSTYILDKETDHGKKTVEFFDLINDLMEEPGNKIVVFSQWKRMFELVIRKLEKKNIPYFYLNGDIPAKKRKEIIEKFQSDNRIKLFLSTDAGGVGVNLQSANILINLDIPWNPAVLDQRIGRIFRLGQKKHIQVYNFISRNSIEHRILYLLDFKRAVFEGVLEEEGNDEVMLEGFMESVREMTSVNLNNDQDWNDAQDVEKTNKEEVLQDKMTESKSLDSSKGNYSGDADLEEPSLPDTKKSRFFGRIKARIRSLLRSLVKGRR